MTITVLNFNTGNVDIYRNYTGGQTDEELHEFLYAQGYNEDEIHWMVSEGAELNMYECEPNGGTTLEYSDDL